MHSSNEEHFEEAAVCLAALKLTLMLTVMKLSQTAKILVLHNCMGNLVARQS